MNVEFDGVDTFKKVQGGGLGWPKFKWSRARTHQAILDPILATSEKSYRVRRAADLGVVAVDANVEFNPHREPAPELSCL